MPAVVMEPTAVIMMAAMAQGIRMAGMGLLPMASDRGARAGALFRMVPKAPPMAVISRGERQTMRPRATHLLSMISPRPDLASSGKCSS